MKFLKSKSIRRFVYCDRNVVEMHLLNFILSKKVKYHHMIIFKKMMKLRRVKGIPEEINNEVNGNSILSVTSSSI